MLGTSVVPNPKSYNPLRKISAGSRLDPSSLIKKIVVTSQNCLQKELENELCTRLHKSAKIDYQMANLLRLDAFLFIQVRTPNSPPKLKELGCLKLEITTALLELLGRPLESSMWWICTPSY